ncbi:hypothetical protein F0L74_09885 [Chitinophaga agrisoli]|uniref:Uncharacterized protein n=1 Tax=Chitinophaga agrisoli TaxID=2607653 RepID=A0A5B2VXS2_9BACT|nr:hypothetical protein [Chitinophaga agrisoli]KAA2242829.1 hypothetical protein F0L74_09885 [Chitinophaga agrisoli]
MNKTTVRILDYAFTVEYCSEGNYGLKIECIMPWGEEVLAYGQLTERDGTWVLVGMTFEDAHDEVTLRDFFSGLLKVRGFAYPQAIEDFRLINQLDQQIEDLRNHFKPAI